MVHIQGVEVEAVQRLEGGFEALAVAFAGVVSGELIQVGGGAFPVSRVFSVVPEYRLRSFVVLVVEVVGSESVVGVDRPQPGVDIGDQVFCRARLALREVGGDGVD